MCSDPGWFPGVRGAARAPLEVTPALLYLVTYLAVSIVSMSVSRYWLGHLRRRGVDPRWLAQARSATAGATLVLGTIWVLEHWTMT